MSKLRKLDAFLISDMVGEDSMLLSEVDGFLAGIIVCPDMIPPSEWMPLAWGSDEPVFKDEKHAQQIFDTIMGHYNDIIHQLNQGSFRPLYDCFGKDEIIWEGWMEGFTCALKLRPEAWLKFLKSGSDVIQTAFFIMGRLGELVTAEYDDIMPMEADEELEVNAPDLIPEQVEILHHARLTAYREQNIPRPGQPEPWQFWADTALCCDDDQGRPQRPLPLRIGQEVQEVLFALN